MAISCVSYIDYIKFTCTVDDTIMKNPDILIKIMDKNLSKIIKMGFPKENFSSSQGSMNNSTDLTSDKELKSE